MNEIAENGNKWYTIQEIAELCGFDVATLKGGKSPLNNLSIDFNTDTRLGGYHNTQKFYSENVLRALKAYQVKNSVPNALRNKETVLTGNVSFTVNETIEKLMDNPETLNLMLQKSLERNQRLGIENKQLKEVVSEMKPKVIAFDRIADGQGCFSMNQAAKALKLPYGNITLYKKLRAAGILNNDNSPNQEQIRSGNFKMVVKFINEKIGNKPVTLATSKGIVYLAKKLNTEIDESIKPDFQQEAV